MIRTRITDMLGIRYPIIGGTMMWISNADFVAAISNAGGLGILASAIYASREEFGAAIDRVQALTNRPFAVNLNLFRPCAPSTTTTTWTSFSKKGSGSWKRRATPRPRSLWPFQGRRPEMDPQMRRGPVCPQSPEPGRRRHHRGRL